MKVLYINNDGGGFADYVDVTEGVTVAQFFLERVPTGEARDYLIRVNRLPVSADQVLHDGDRVSFTPTKIEGAYPSRKPPRHLAGCCLAARCAIVVAPGRSILSTRHPGIL